MIEIIAAAVGISTVGTKRTALLALPSHLPTVLRDRRPRAGLRSVHLAQLSQLRQIRKRELTTAIQPVLSVTLLTEDVAFVAVL